MGSMLVTARGELMYQLRMAALIAMLATTALVALRYLAVSAAFAWLTGRVAPGLYRRAQRCGQIRREIGWSLAAAAVYGGPAGLMMFAWQHGHSKVYTAVDAYGVPWLFGSVAIYLLLHDSWFYWTHRAMHRPRLFRLMHAVHHHSRPPTAWAAMSFHPLEALTGALVIPALTFVVPIHIAALGLVLAVMSVFGVTNHLGWEIFPRRLLAGRFGALVISAAHHHRHHLSYQCNYGLYFRMWDRLCRTDGGLAGNMLHARDAREAPDMRQAENILDESHDRQARRAG